ncbi:UDP-glycosyltransferase 76C2-like [Miscanthus floridulus]|uniref:UDP-glycosyltransferase 76C2-like n=1 Tax=Miscanthus floridulus TaxID=154761 RepID=UPI00345A540C
MAGVDRHRPAPRIALFPLPFQGHISPMLQLAGALHARGLTITVLHMAFNAPDPARHPGFSFVAVPDTISDVVATTKDSIAKILALNAVVEAPAMAECVRSVLASLLKPEEGEPRLACLILDCTLTGIQKVAVGLGIPTPGFFYR